MTTTMWESVLTLPVSPERDHVRGPQEAPLSMVEYGDYECPFCGMAYPVVEEIIDTVGDRLLFAYRHFPLTTMHPHAWPAAEAAEAAGAQGQFWEMHALLFTDQRHLDGPDLVARADVLGLDVERFVEELRTGVHTDKVHMDFMSGVRSGVNGTPTFFINGHRHDGAADAASLMRALQRTASNLA
ncbi:MAG: oxidoreductase [Acidimicrobiales bacterium]|nr:oxidoreductase [Acidimicrobiales bacterium]